MTYLYFALYDLPQIYSASSSIIEVIKNPHQLSPESLKRAFNDQLQKVLKLTQKSNFHLLPLQRNPSILCSGNENLNVETYHPQDDTPDF